ncbi:MAG TPA: twin-arginine translocase TatA/TatE family subunit [Patescibacteria group bacterium]|nr:twin-arginine translocase TatA/TatE family subunit [Patescibacteria group bacterium]
MLNFSMPEVGAILVVALLVFGPGKLPEAGKALGKGLGELRRAVAGELPGDQAVNAAAKTLENKAGEGR